MSNRAQPLPKKSSLARSSLLMFAGTLTSRVLGFIRSPLLLGAAIGINYPAANAFDIANRLPNLIYMIVIGGVVNAVLVPAIVRAAKNSEDDGAAFINKLMTLTVVSLGVVSALLTALAPVIVKMFAATMDPQWYAITLALAFWCIPQVFFYGLYTVIGQVLNARENFGPYMWAPALNNVVAIGALCLLLQTYGHADVATATNSQLWTWPRIALLGGGATAGIAAQALILLWPLRRLGIKIRPDFHWRNAGLGGAARASWWMALTMLFSIIPSAIQSNVAAAATDRALQAHADLLTVAGNAAYTTAYTVYSLPTSLIVVSITTAIFTRLSNYAADSDYSNLQATITHTIRLIGFLMFLCTAGIIVLAVPGVRILAATVSMNEVVAIAKVLIAMTLGLLAISADTVLTRVFYALEDTRGAFYIGLPFQIYGAIGMLACAYLPMEYVVVGICLIGATANIFGFLITFWWLSRKLQKLGAGPLQTRIIALSYLKIGFITLLTMAAGWSVLRLFGSFFAEISISKAILEIITVGPVMLVVYLGFSLLFKAPEALWAIKPALQKIPFLASR